MLPLGHLSGAYLISQIPLPGKEKVGKKEVIFILFCGIIFDLDFLLPNLVGMPSGSHHYLPTHTPMAGIIYWLILYFWLRRKLPFWALALGGAAMLSHLVFDDLSYWLSLVGVFNQYKPQIFWLYPFDDRMAEETAKFMDYYYNYPYSDTQFYTRYLTRMPPLLGLEILMALLSAGIAMRQQRQEKRKKSERR